jgi:hypothetical protein
MKSGYWVGRRRRGLSFGHCSMVDVVVGAASDALLRLRFVGDAGAESDVGVALALFICSRVRQAIGSSVLGSICQGEVCMSFTPIGCWCVPLGRGTRFL